MLRGEGRHDIGRGGCQPHIPRAQGVSGGARGDVVRLAGEGDATPEGDVDLRLEIDRSKTCSLFDVAELHAALETALGMSVDLVTADNLSPRFSDAIVRDGALVYERAVQARAKAKG